MTRHVALGSSTLATLLFGLPLAVIARPTHAPGAHAAAAPLVAVNALFAAMSRHDAGAARKLLVPNARFMVMRADGTVRTSDDAQFLDALGKNTKALWKERIWSPQVRVDGAMAQVWAPYDFHLDGQFSHCGIDTFTLVHGAEGWRIAAIAYTVRKDHCPAGG
jgi:hypothetical protein